MHLRKETYTINQENWILKKKGVNHYVFRQIKERKLFIGDHQTFQQQSFCHSDSKKRMQQLLNEEVYSLSLEEILLPVHFVLSPLSVPKEWPSILYNLSSCFLSQLSTIQFFSDSLSHPLPRPTISSTSGLIQQQMSGEKIRNLGQ